MTSSNGVVIKRSPRQQGFITTMACGLRRVGRRKNRDMPLSSANRTRNMEQSIVMMRWRSVFSFNQMAINCLEMPGPGTSNRTKSCDCLCLVGSYDSGLLFGTEDRIDRCAADRALTLKGRFTILHGHLLGVFHLSLRFAFDTIVQISHSKVASLRPLKKTYIPCIGMYCTRQVDIISLCLHVFLHS